MRQTALKIGRRLAKEFGFEIIKSTALPTRETALGEIFRRLDISIVLDVGANIGQYGLALRAIGYRGLICSFEPARRSFERLEEVARHDRDWRLFPYALGDRGGAREINVSTDSEFSSFLPVNAYGAGRYLEKSEVLRQERVEVMTLDEWFAKEMIGAQGNIFLKVDTQGYDLAVIKGGRLSMPRIAGLQSELSMRPIYDGMPRYLEALEHYESLGFQLLGSYPVSRDPLDGTLIEVDCLMVRPASRGLGPQGRSAS